MKPIRLQRAETTGHRQFDRQTDRPTDLNLMISIVSSSSGNFHPPLFAGLG
ncbi:FKBP1B protein [Anopheles sinensis]|uniref:FKBP1B protein n=1 Tax=Anopheles sinensis TaxID=74873 RepID=A0A084VEJ2_ANOSI|nr:FKBP1B protein [Anopheles sinensis]